LSEETGTAGATECLVVLNPTAGAGAGARLRGEIERELRSRGVPFELRATTSHGHARELAAAAAAAGIPAVVAAGGDGTIHDVACGILEAATATRLGTIPIGRGNDFVKVVGIAGRAAAYAALAAGRTRTIDAGRVRWQNGAEFFVNGMGTGIDVEVVRQILRARNVPRRLVYIVGLARALLRYRAIPLAVSVDGRRIEKRVMTATVTNGSCIGGNFRICPTARPDDGMLDLCLIDEVGLLSAARLAPKVLRATHADDPAVTMVRAASFTIESEQPLVFQIDGELREPPGVLRLLVDVLPGALRVLAPHTGPDAVDDAAAAAAVRQPSA